MLQTLWVASPTVVVIATTYWRWGFSPAKNPGLKPQLHRLSLAATIAYDRSRVTRHVTVYKVGLAKCNQTSTSWGKVTLVGAVNEVLTNVL
jgi:hypothetical protein